METMISNRGKQILIIEGQKFIYHSTLKDDNHKWRCYLKGCKAYAKTNSSGDLYACHLQHTHGPPGNSELYWERLKNTVKDKISMGEDIEDIMQNLPEEVSRDEVQRLKCYANRWILKSPSRPCTDTAGL